MSALYTLRQASSSDAPAVLRLWWPFIRERAEVDRSLVVKPDADFASFVDRELRASNSFCWLADHRPGAPEQAQSTSAVGLVIWYLDIEQSDALSPFEPRRCGKVLGLYVEPAHRGSGCAALLVDCALRHAESMGVSDIDVLVAAEQTGLHALLERRGLSRVATQFTRHYAPAERAAAASRGDKQSADAEASAADRIVRASRFGHRFA